MARDMFLLGHRVRYFTSPVCLLWMVPAALLTEIPAALRLNSFELVGRHPLMFAASALAGGFVNLTSFLLVKRTSSMTLKTMTMARNGGTAAATSEGSLGEVVSWMAKVPLRTPTPSCARVALVRAGDCLRSAHG
jgi:hypothetical protein